MPIFGTIIQHTCCNSKKCVAEKKEHEDLHQMRVYTERVLGYVAFLNDEPTNPSVKKFATVSKRMNEAGSLAVVREKHKSQLCGMRAGKKFERETNQIGGRPSPTTCFNDNSLRYWVGWG